MNRSLLTLATLFIASGLLSLAGCNNNAGNTTPAPAPNATSQSGSLTDELGVQVPTQEEADAAAAKQITAENADEALKQLEAEVDGGK